MFFNNLPFLKRQFSNFYCILQSITKLITNDNTLQTKQLMKYLTFLFLLIAQLSLAQSKSLTKIIDRIDYQNDTIQAVYDWVTDNIKYDVKKLKNRKKGKRRLKRENFKSNEEYKAALLEDVIKKKKGVCDDYTRLFDAIVSNLGYESFIVAGITKDYKGKINRTSSHSWSAVKVNGTWKLYDPTWGAGNVKDGKKFVKKYTPIWYDVDPKVMVERHFPFDPIWQLLGNSIIYEEFKKDMNSGSSEHKFDCIPMVESHLKKNEEEQLIDRLERSILFGGNTSRIKKHRKTLQKKIDYFGISSNTDLINTTLNNFRTSSELFGEYIKEAKNKRFKDKKWTLEYSQSTLLEMRDLVTESITTLDGIDVKDSKSKRVFKKSITQAKSLLEYVDKELKYIDSKMSNPNRY